MSALLHKHRPSFSAPSSSSSHSEDEKDEIKFSFVMYRRNVGKPYLILQRNNKMYAIISIIPSTHCTITLQHRYYIGHKKVSEGCLRSSFVVSVIKAHLTDLLEERPSLSFYLWGNLFFICFKKWFHLFFQLGYNQFNQINRFRSQIK